MRTLLGMQYGGNVPQQYPRQQIPPQQFQAGGGVSSGLAFLKRGQAKRQAEDEARSRERAMGKRIGSGRTLGSLLGVGGGLLGAALAPVTGGVSLALAAGLGTAAGKYAGSRIGYGKDKEMSDMLYGKEAGFKDIAEAGKGYRSQMGQEALLSGAKAGLTAGFAPSGGMYGKVAGKLRPTDVAGATASLGGVGTASQVADLGAQVTPEMEIAKRAMGSQAFQPQVGSMAPGSLLGAGALLDGGAEALLGGAGSAPVDFGGAIQDRSQYQDIINKFFEQFGEKERTVSNWESLFPQAQQGGMIKQNPQSLLGYLG